MKNRQGRKILEQIYGEGCFMERAGIRKITPEELLEEYNDAKRLNGYKNHKIIQELNENFVKSFITQEKQNIPSISDVEKEVVSDPEPSSHSDANFSDELKFTKTPEFEKPAEDIQVEDFDSNSSKTDPEKEEPVINKRQLSYSDFLIEASKLETPEAYEKFFNENFNCVSRIIFFFAN